MRERGPKVFLVLALLVAFAAFLMVRRYLTAVVLAMAIGYLLHPVYRWLASRIPKKWPAATLMLLMVTVLLFGPFAILIAVVYKDALALVQGIDSRAALEERVGSALGGLGVPQSTVEDWAGRILQEAADYLRASAVPLATMATEVLLSLVVFYILLFYVFVDGQRLIDYVARALPAPTPQIKGLERRIGDRVEGIAFGTIGVSVVQGLLAGLGWWLLGLPAPVFWGFVMMILSVVPVIGAFLILIPAAVWSFMQGDLLAGIGLLVLNFVMVGLVDDVLRPYVIGRRSNVHPTLILLGIAGGIPLFGLAGLVLGPLLMGTLVPLWEAWAHPDQAAGDPAQPAADPS